jgi:hypothetical protein
MDMFNPHQDVISPELARSIEDAILLGHVKEIDAVLNIVEIDPDFPDELRYGLQALRYFRAHYGKGGVAEPEEKLQRQKAALLEASWGAELLDMLKRSEKRAAFQRRA